LSWHFIVSPRLVAFQLIEERRSNCLQLGNRVLLWREGLHSLSKVRASRHPETALTVRFRCAFSSPDLRRTPLPLASALHMLLTTRAPQSKAHALA